MGKREQIWQSLEDPEYRRLFAEDVGTGLAFQIKLMRDDRGWTQSELGERTEKAQETISQLENPDYGRFTLATLQKLAAAFDVGLFVKFVPFGELVDWNVNLTPERLAPPSFDQEVEEESEEQAQTTDNIPLTRTAMSPSFTYAANFSGVFQYGSVSDHQPAIVPVLGEWVLSKGDELPYSGTAFPPEGTLRPQKASQQEVVNAA